MRQLEKPNVLIVDDRHENLVALEAILEGMDINIVKANSGASALWYLLNREFALILLDVEMPEMDGFETAEFIRQRRRTQLIPIIFVTAINKSDQQVFRGYSVGAVDYLFKPFAPEVLRSKVSVFVDLFKANRELAQHAERLLESNLQLEETNQKVAGLNREISRQSAELKAERDFVSTILDTVGCLVAVLTADGKIVLFNRACEELTAHEFEEVKGCSFWETCLADEGHDEARREFVRVLATGR
jgi:response regulator RpfG family c-di-GMP phosphodiesterase